MTKKSIPPEVRAYLEEKEWGYPYGRHYETPRVNKIDINGYVLDGEIDDDLDDCLND